MCQNKFECFQLRHIFCLWRNKQNSFHNVITMDDLIKNCSNRLCFQTTVAEIWSALLILFGLLKMPLAFLARLTIILNWRLHCSSRPQQLFIDPLAIQWHPFDPVTIYRPLGWSIWPLGVDIDHFENHWSNTRWQLIFKYMLQHVIIIISKKLCLFNPFKAHNLFSMIQNSM